MNSATSAMRRTLSLCIAIFCILFTGAAQAATIHVPADQPTIYAAMVAASDGDIILIADGTYTGPDNRLLPFSGKAITVQSESDNPVACIIDCQGLDPGFGFFASEGPTSVLRGLTIKNGAADAGGGVYISGAAPTITNCIFIGNTAVDNEGALGGAIYSEYGAATITDCVFETNSATGPSGVTGADAAGGAFYGYVDAPTFIHCTFTSNSATGGDGSDSAGVGFGGGIFTDVVSVPWVISCTFNGNTAQGGSGHDASTGAGGAVMTFFAYPGSFVANCIFSGNQAIGGHGDKGIGSAYGGAVAEIYSDMALVNCTTSENSALGDLGAVGGPGTGGAFYTTDATDLVNCIFYGDHANGVYPEIATEDLGLVVEYCIVKGGYAGATNMGTNPLFVRAPFTGGLTDFGDLHVKTGSPAIDAGINSAPAFYGITTDHDGNPRVDNGTVDIGAYEGNPNNPPVANAGPDQHIDSKLTVKVTLDGSGSSDPDSDPLTYVWKENGSQIATGVKPKIFLDPGIHTITLTVNDGRGGTSTDTVVITVDPRTPTAVILSNVTAQRGKEKHFPAHLKTMLKHQVGQLLDKPVNFYVDGNFIGTINSANPTGLSFTPPTGMTLGAHTMKVTFAGDLDYQPSEKTVTLTIKK